MSARLFLLALSTLLLSACDGNPLQTAARQTACCCDRCPTSAAPADKPGQTASAGGTTRVVATGGETTTYHRRAMPGGVGRAGYVRYASSEESLAGGGYGGRYGAGGGVSVSVTESESASSRYSYRESSSGYAYGSGSASGGAYAGGEAYGYGPGGPGGVRASSDPPHYNSYPTAHTDADGYLTWPGKVED